MNKQYDYIDYDNVTYIDIYNDIKNNDYLLADNIHLNKDGNKYLSDILNNIINK